MVDWKKKLTSRKFWAAIASFVSMLIIALGGTEETGTQITALIMAGASVIAYIVGEGLADAAGAQEGWLRKPQPRKREAARRIKRTSSLPRSACGSHCAALQNNKIMRLSFGGGAILFFVFPGRFFDESAAITMQWGRRHSLAGKEAMVEKAL